MLRRRALTPPEQSLAESDLEEADMAALPPLVYLNAHRLILSTEG